MKSSELVLHLRGCVEPICYNIATDERQRWLDSHQPERRLHGFGEYRSINHCHLFINHNHVVVARLLNDQMLQVPDNYDEAWSRRKETEPESGDFWPERWFFRFWVQGINAPFKVADLDEHDFVTISCGLLNNEHDGQAFVSVVDEDGEPISFRIADVMLAEGFDYQNYEMADRDN
jgi:hypothetical protein